FASAVAVFFEPPRPPRLPRRRLGLVLLDCPASAAGSVLRGSGASGAAASRGACSSDFLDRNQRKKNHLRARALQQRRLERRRGACAAGCGRWKTSTHRVPTGLPGAHERFSTLETGNFAAAAATTAGSKRRPAQVLGFAPNQRPPRNHHGSREARGGFLGVKGGGLRVTGQREAHELLLIEE